MHRKAEEESHSGVLWATTRTQRGAAWAAHTSSDFGCSTLPGASESDLGDQDGIATPGRRSRLGTGLDREADLVARLGRDTQLLHGFHPVAQRLLKCGAIGKGPSHLDDPAVFAVALHPGSRVYFGVPIHQADFGDRGSGRKFESDDLANAIAVAPPRCVHTPVDHLFGSVDDWVTGAIGGLWRLAVDAHLARRQQGNLTRGLRAGGRSLCRAGHPRGGGRDPPSVTAAVTQAPPLLLL